MIWGKGKNVIGLDIGSSSVKLVELKEGRNGYKLQNLAIAPLPPEAIVDGAVMDSVTIVDTIRDLVTSATKTKDVVTSVSGHSVIVKKITLFVEANKFTTCSVTGIKRKNIFLSKWCRTNRNLDKDLRCRDSDHYGESARSDWNHYQ